MAQRAFESVEPRNMHLFYDPFQSFGSPYHLNSSSGQNVAALDDAIGINASQTDSSTTFDHCFSFHDLRNGNSAFEENESHDGCLENPKFFIGAATLEHAPSLPEKITPSKRNSDNACRLPSSSRIRVACQLCVAAKTRCDNERPCGRCQRRGTEEICVDRKKLCRQDVHEPPPLKCSIVSLRTRACITCAQSKIRCDELRPCGECRKRNRKDCCIDAAKIVNLSTSSKHLYRIQFQESAFLAPISVQRVWQFGYRRYTPPVLCVFLNSNRAMPFLSFCEEFSYINGRLLIDNMKELAEESSLKESDFVARQSLNWFYIVNPSMALTLSFPMIMFNTSVTPTCGQIVLSFYMNKLAQRLWGYSHDDMMEASLTNSSLQANGAFVLRLWHQECWPRINEIYLEAWILGALIEDQQLCAIRRDLSQVQTQTRWFFTSSKNGFFEKAGILIQPL